jgi:hypothetical protein
LIYIEKPRMHGDMEHPRLEGTKDLGFGLNIGGLMMFVV